MQATLRRGVGGIIESVSLLVVVRLLGLWWALALAVVIWGYYNRGKARDLASGLLGIGLVSLVIVLVLNHNLVGQILVACGYSWWRWAGNTEHPNQRFEIWQAGWLEFISLTAIFSANAIWHWPTLLTLIAVYVTSLVIARSFFAAGERAARALAAAWGLIVAECCYIFSVWLVHYVLPGGVLLIPQAAIVITALGYCFGSIYLAHTTSKLSKARLAEYAIIGLCLIVIVIAGTKWSGQI